jgi:ABC-type glycerol-3-phosphate transport system permease component
MNSSWQRVYAVATIALVALGLLPVLAALVASFTPESRIFGAPSLDLRGLTLDHYRRSSRRASSGCRFAIRLLWPSTTVLAVAIGGLCAYAIARLTFRQAVHSRRGAGGFRVSADCHRVAVVLVLREVHLIDTYPGLVLPY